MPTNGKYRILFAQFPGGQSSHPNTNDWVTDTFVKMLSDSRIGPGNVLRFSQSTTPITKARNKALVVAKEHDCDFVLMIDSDMHPDRYLKPEYQHLNPGAKPFWETTWEYALKSPVPTVIAAPYCGPPPIENVFVFHWTNYQSEHPSCDFQITGYSRAHASELVGIQPAAALPTGLMLIDMRAVDMLPHPRFYYEYKDETQSDLTSTEDVTFSRDLWYYCKGVFVGCNWDAWAGHHKIKDVGKPYRIPESVIPDWFEKRLSDKPRPTPPANGKPQIVATIPEEKGECELPSSTAEAVDLRHHGDMSDAAKSAAVSTSAASCTPPDFGPKWGAWQYEQYLTQTFQHQFKRPPSDTELVELKSQAKSMAERTGTA